MRKVLTAAEMREVDRLTTERYGIPSIILMENAAHAVARVITEKLDGSVEGKSVLILCGKGNNGGDGAAIARLLSNAGARIRLIIFAKINQTIGEARANFERLPNAVEVSESEEWWQAWEYINPVDWKGLECVVDAVFGTGLSHYRDDLNEIIGSFSEVLHVAVDLPSGLMANETGTEATQYCSDITVTFTAPKPANILPPASQFNGELIVADIGSPHELIDKQPSQLFLAEREDAAEWLRASQFSSDSYKNKRGHALLIAGSEAYSGAAVLAANVAARSGVGLVTVGTPRSSKDPVASRVLPEVMVRGLSETSGGAVSDSAIGEVEELLAKADAVAIGCGLDSTDSETGEFVRHFVTNRTVPTILDADALNLIAPMHKPARQQGRNRWIDENALANARAYAEKNPLILTPHEGEFMRLLGTDDKDAIKDRVAAVREFSQKHNVILVLKGERVLIGEPGGKVVVNPTGNSGLGKAGNGDTLAGIVLGFVAQASAMNVDIFETVVAAVYMAGMAGDIAERKFGKRVMTASDVRECLTDVFATIENSDHD